MEIPFFESSREKYDLLRAAIGTEYLNRQSRVVHRRSLDFNTQTSVVSVKMRQKSLGFIPGLDFATQSV